MGELIERLTAAIRADLQAQAEKIYFWDPADSELFIEGPAEMSAFEGGLMLADRFDLAATVRAALTAALEPTKAQVIAGQDELETCVDREEWSDADGDRHSETRLHLTSAPADLWRVMVKAELDQ